LLVQNYFVKLLLNKTHKERRERERKRKEKERKGVFKSCFLDHYFYKTLAPLFVLII
jgi:hypothetical protein